MFDPFSQLFQHFWGHARALHMVLELHSFVLLYYRSNPFNLSILWRSEKVQQERSCLSPGFRILNLSNGNPSHNALQDRYGTKVEKTILQSRTKLKTA